MQIPNTVYVIIATHDQGAVQIETVYSNRAEAELRVAELNETKGRGWHYYASPQYLFISRKEEKRWKS
jgi:hypothetical protein